MSNSISSVGKAINKLVFILYSILAPSLAGLAQTVNSPDGNFNAVNANGNLTLRTTTNSVLTARLTILGASGATAGFVGIGTTSPADQLHVAGNTRTNQLNLLTGVLNTASGTTNMSFNINGTNRMTLLAASGNLGIGTTTPADLLHVNGMARANQVNLVNGVLNTASGTTNMSFNINGTNRMTLLASNGNFGIGTTTPSDLLHVNGMARASQYNSTTGNFFTVGATNLSLGTNGVAQMTLLNASGNVGIGTATPAYRLDVAGSVNATGLFVNGQPVSVGASQWTTGTGNISYSGGNVGVGTTIADGFQVNAPLASQVAQGSSNIRMGIIGNAPRLIFDCQNATPFQIDNSGGQLRIFNPGVVRMVINSDGNVGIGTTNTNAKLHVSAATDALIGLRLEAGSFSMGGSARFQIDAPGIVGGRLAVAENGNVGIGSANPNQKLTVNGTIYGKEVKVDLNVPGPDYVFEPEYKVMPLDELKRYIERNKHLPEIPSAKRWRRLV